MKSPRQLDIESIRTLELENEATQQRIEENKKRIRVIQWARELALCS